ncbi:hypothetical protein C2G38_2228269 [Gigaspora rosea]|uniref:Uncharacterized protein n=1 Tax=Gigaspora rosea TaxID=44941 RepID=A0A397TZB0_9GLOM|nr:hypothetical protein C2G38_2228269 [Gigaspora rosea]
MVHNYRTTRSQRRNNSNVLFGVIDTLQGENRRSKKIKEKDCRARRRIRRKKNLCGRGGNRKLAARGEIFTERNRLRVQVEDLEDRLREAKAGRNN